MPFRWKHRINKTLSRDPFSLNKSLIKSARIKTFISFFNAFRQRGIVVHSEMDIQNIFFFGFFYPFHIKPMIRMLRIAVEKVFWIFKRAPCNRLFNKTSRHKRNLVEHNATQSHTLNEWCTWFISAAEKIITVSHIASWNRNHIPANPVINAETKFFKRRQKRSNNISPKWRNCFPANGKRSIAKSIKGPTNKRYTHTKRFAWPYGAVTDYSVFIFNVTAIAPPIQNGKLLFWKRDKSIHQIPPYNAF